MIQDALEFGKLTTSPISWINILSLNISLILFLHVTKY